MVSKNKIMVSKNCMETFSDLGSSLGDIRYNFRWKVHTKAYCILEDTCHFSKIFCFI